jgi:hypothetical protein
VVKKLVSSLTIFLIAVLGLSQVSPAQAWPDSTVVATPLTSSDWRSGVGSIGKSVNSNMVYAFVGNEPGASYIRAYTLSPAGILTAPVDIARSVEEGVSFHFNPTKNTWLDSSGTFHLLYKKWDSTQTIRKTTLNYVTSKDGVVWSAPFTIATKTYQVGDPCTAGQDGCGIDQVALAHTPTQQLALVYSSLNSDGTKQVYFTTKLPGKNWLSPQALDSSTLAPYQLDLAYAGRGFVASWINNTGSSFRLMSAFSNGTSFKTWTAPQERAVSSAIVHLGLLQVGTNKYGLVYSTPSGLAHQQNVYMQTFDSKSMRFGAAQLIVSLSGTDDLTYIFPTEFVAGQSAIAFTTWTPSTLGEARYILFRNGVGIPQYVNQELLSVDSVTQFTSGASMDKSGHLSIVWLAQDLNADTSDLYLSQYFRGNRSDVVLSNDAAEYFVGYSPDSDVYVSSFWNQSISGYVRIRSDAPALTSDVAVKGTSKVGKTVTTKLPSLEADSVGQKWQFNYQWYSCQFQVTQVANIASNNCTVIPGATASSYKAKSTDKGKFLQVKLSVKSDNATQVQFSASTLAVK